MYHFLKFLFVCGVAFLAHKSALFFVLVYFIYAEKITPIRMITISVIAMVISRNYEIIFSIIGWLNDSNASNIEYVNRSVNILRTLAGCAPAVLGIYYGFTRKLDKEQIFYVYILVANAAVKIATSDSAYLARLSLYTSAFVPLGLSSILKATEFRYRKIFKIGITVLYFALWFYEVINTKTLREFEWIFSYL